MVSDLKEEKEPKVYKILWYDRKYCLVYLTDFNSMRHCDGLFYPSRLENNVYCTFIFDFEDLWSIGLPLKTY